MVSHLNKKCKNWGGLVLVDSKDMIDTKYKLSIRDALYLVVIGVNIFLRSMFNLGSVGTYLSYGLILILTFLAIPKVSMDYKGILWLILGLFLSIGIKSLQCFFMVLMSFNIYAVNISRIKKNIIVTIISCLLLIYMATLLGLIPNLVVIRNGISRMAFGTQFPLVFSTYIFYACVYITLMFYKSNPVKLSIILLLVVLFLDKTTNSRNDEISILLLILIIACSNLPHVYLKGIYIISTVISFTLIIFSMFVTNIVPYTSNWYYFFDKLVSGRLSLQYILFMNYSPHMLGQYIPQVGFGGGEQVYNYFYIDNSYLRMLFMYGALFFIYAMLTITFQLIKKYRNKQFIVGLIVLVILINGISADSLTMLTQNIIVFPLLFLNVKNNNGLKKEVNSWII